MPGIVGIISANKDKRHVEELREMLQLCQHEPHHRTGIYANADAGLYVGWVTDKDSIYTDELRWNEAKDRCAIFVGEDFQHSDAGSETGRRGGDGRGAHEAAMRRIVAGDVSGGVRCVNGFFHGLVLDTTARRVSVFNDRFGMQRLYWYQKGDEYFFAAEAKAILRLCPELRRFDLGSLGQWLTMGCVLGGKTLYAGLELMPGASVWTFENGRLEERQRYFSVEEWRSQPRLQEHEFYEELRHWASAKIGSYLGGSAKIGVSLTGGLDTRIIMAHAAHCRDALPCYTFGSMYRDSFDVKVARQVAELCHKPHATIKIGGEFLSNFEYWAKKAVFISDGYVDAASGAVELYANARARQVAPIRMTGSHGSEVLRGMRGFRCKLALRNLFAEDIEKQMGAAAAIFAETLKRDSLSHAIFTEAPFFNYHRMSLEQSQVVKRTPFMDNHLLALLCRAPAHALTNDRMSFELVKDGNEKLADVVTNRGAGGLHRGLLSSCRQMLYEGLKRAEFAYDLSMPHAVSRADWFLATLHLENLCLGWNGFYHFRKWFRDELSDVVTEILLDRETRARPYFRKGAMDRIVSGHIREGYNYANEINAALTVELAHRAMHELS